MPGGPATHMQGACTVNLSTSGLRGKGTANGQAGRVGTVAAPRGS